MDSLDYWRICDELNIIQAALLLVECNPSDEFYYVENWQPHKRPPGYEAAKTAISNALRREAIKGKLIPMFDSDSNGNKYPLEDSIDLFESRVEVESLRIWLTSRGIRTGFYFPNATSDAPDYLDPLNPRYAPKLAAAVRAWQAVTDPKGKHPKQALVKWLRENAAGFALTDDEGKPNETGIEEVSKVANWQPGGGAPKTPSV